MKRQRSEMTERSNIELENCLMLLPLVQEIRNEENSAKRISSGMGPTEFECKTCNRKFSSFQALGGHRASHKRQKQVEEEESSGEGLKKEGKSLRLWSKPKMHECSVCGLEFSLGQALGGHMRKHRGGGGIATTASAINQQHFSSSSIHRVIAKTPVLTRSNSRRIMCLDLDLNLTLSLF